MPTLTLAELCALFAQSTGRPSSAREYRGVLGAFTRFAHAEGVTSPAAVDPTLLARYQIELLQLAPSTRHHRLLLLRQFLRFAESSRLCPPGLSTAIRLQPLPAHHPAPAISLPEQSRLIAAAPDARSRLLVWLLLGSGARISELLACNLSSFQEGLLQLTGKTGTRSVLLSHRLCSVLEEHIWRAVSGGARRSDPLFRSRQGRLSDRRARELLAQCCLLAELPPLSPHDLRHAACSRWLRAGIPLVVVSQTLGHSRPSVTLDHYASATALDMERGLASDPLDAVVPRDLDDPTGPRERAQAQISRGRL